MTRSSSGLFKTAQSPLTHSTSAETRAKKCIVASPSNVFETNLARVRQRRHSFSVCQQATPSDSAVHAKKSALGSRRHRNRYSHCKIIASGSYGNVSLCWDHVLCTHVAIKYFKCDPETDFIEYDELCEIEMLKTVSPHQNLIALLDVLGPNRILKGDSLLAIAMPYFVAGTLRTYGDLYTSGAFSTGRKKVSSMPVPLVRRFSRQLYSVLSHLHKHRVVHCDLKPDNILIDVVENKIVLCDFGMAQTMHIDKETPFRHFVADGVLCTLWYRPPEALLWRRTMTEKFDLWSAALIVAEMLCGYALFRGQDTNNQMTMILETLGTPSEAEWPDLRKSFKWDSEWGSFKGTGLSTFIADSHGLAFVQEMLVCNPKKRPGTQEALQHAFLDTKACEAARHTLPRLPLKVAENLSFHTCKTE